jgi:predicted SAM-dependent methyltransferase
MVVLVLVEVFIMESRKLNFGCGTKYASGWFNVDGGEHLIDKHKVDFMFRFEKFPYPLKNDWFDQILVQHVLEHISWRKQEQVLKELFRVARSGCVMVIEVPDLKVVCQDVLGGIADGQVLVKKGTGMITMENFVLHDLMGGQCHDEDFHIGMLWKERLERLVINSGWKLVNIGTFGRTLKAECVKK